MTLAAVALESRDFAGDPFPALPSRTARSEPHTGSHHVTVLSALLEQLRGVIIDMPTPMYRARPAARVSGSIGQHVRHCLDHVSALVAAMYGDELSYDRRARGTTVENEPGLAADEISRLVSRLERQATVLLDRPLTLWSLLDANGSAVAIRTTVGREIAFVIQHTIHHCALIAVLLEWQGGRVPPNFGVAPSTVRARLHP